MIDLQSAVITAAVLLAVLGVGYWIWKRRSSATPDKEQREQTEEDLQIEAADPKRHERVGLIGRARVQPPTTLVFFASVVGVMVVIMVGVYQVMKTGSPSEMAYASQLRYAASVLVFLGGGVWFKAWMDDKAGQLAITYEGSDANVTEIVYYDRSLVQPLFDDEGERDALLVPVFKPNRILGVFWMPKLVADEPAIRDVDKNLPEDQIMYEVPLDESSTWNQEAGRITVRAKRDDPVTNPRRRATYQFVPSDRKSDAEIQDIQDENEQLRKKLAHERRMNGILTEQIETLEEEMENRDYAGLDHLDESLDVLLQVMDATAPNGRYRTGDRALDGTGGNGATASGDSGRSSGSASPSGSSSN